MSSHINKVRDAAVDACMPAARLGVFMAIARSANSSTGIAWPTQETIGERVQLQPRAVRRHINRLIEDGWITVVRKAQGGEGRAGVPNMYKLKVPSEADEKKPDEDAQETSKSPARVVPMTASRPQERRSFPLQGDSGFDIEEAMNAVGEPEDF